MAGSWARRFRGGGSRGSDVRSVAVAVLAFARSSERQLDGVPRAAMAATVLALWAAGPLAAGGGCSSTPPPRDCGIESTILEANPLTSLPEARIDRVGSAFVLLGTDGSVVRWGRLGLDGHAGDWHEVAVPPHTDGPWFAVAGADTPADHLVVAFAAGGATPDAMADLQAFSVRFDNTASTLPLSIGQIPDVRSSPVTVAMTSGRAGTHAAMIWGTPGSPDVHARLLDGEAGVLGGDLIIASMVGDLACLRFQPGKSDATVGFVDLSGMASHPTFVVTEIDDAGAIQPASLIPVGEQLPGCVELVATPSGYGLAWHATGIGVIFGAFTPMASAFPTELVLSDVGVSDVPPSLGGLGWTGKDYSLVFNHESGAEVWSLDAMGKKVGPSLVFPSQQMRTGSLSVQPVDDVLYATYADYTSSDPGDLAAGQRLLVKVSCP